MTITSKIRSALRKITTEISALMIMTGLGLAFYLNVTNLTLSELGIMIAHPVQLAASLGLMIGGTAIRFFIEEK